MALHHASAFDAPVLHRAPVVVNLAVFLARRGAQKHAHSIPASLTPRKGQGLVKSDTPQGKLRFALPLHALRFYFPALWPEAEADPGELVN